MFIPLGFGQWPQRIPVVILAITAICLVWSYAYFPKIQGFESRVRDKYTIHKITLDLKVKEAVVAACNIRFPMSKMCGILAEERGKSRNSTDFKAKDISVSAVANIVAFMQELKSDPESWPEDVKGTPEFRILRDEYNALRAEIRSLASKEAMTIKGQATLFHLIRSTFTHGGYVHLFGNLFFLIIFGIWVEQRAGAVIAALTFFAGSLFGTAIQLFASPDQPVLGASAGISALMGSFFLYFRRAEFQFLFTFGLMYFKRVWIPLLYTFPFFYLLSDITALGAQQNSGVAHVAHLGGLAIGLIVAGVVNKYLPLPDSTFFFEEDAPLIAIRKSDTAEELWRALETLTAWNAQNWLGIENALRRMQELKLTIDKPDKIRKLRKIVASFVGHTFRRGTADEMIASLRLVPAGLDKMEMLQPVPVSQALFLADKSANDGQFDVALPLYNIALSKAKSEGQRQVIRNAIQTIQLRGEAKWNHR